MLDVALFSALLYFTGGPTNPFSFLYVVYLAIGALLLDAAWSWALAVLAFAMLGLVNVASPVGEHHEHLKLHLHGRWFALGAAAGFIVYFVGRISVALTERERQLEQARRLASLATLATTAAHELSTPLSTIAVAARELEKGLGRDDARKDAELVRREVERCRAILSHQRVVHLRVLDVLIRHGRLVQRERLHLGVGVRPARAADHEMILAKPVDHRADVP